MNNVTTDTITGINGTIAEIIITLPAPEHKRVSNVNDRRGTVTAHVSSRTGDAIYNVTLSTRHTMCNCPAGRYGRPCWHTKAVAEVYGLMMARDRVAYQQLVEEVGDAQEVARTWRMALDAHKGSKLAATEATLERYTRRQAA